MHLKPVFQRAYSGLGCNTCTVSLAGARSGSGDTRTWLKQPVLGLPSARSAPQGFEEGGIQEANGLPGGCRRGHKGDLKPLPLNGSRPRTAQLQVYGRVPATDAAQA